jgi:NAD(P)H-flavin reductase
MQGEGTITELLLSHGLPTARVACAPGLVPSAGQYTRAHEEGSPAPLADVLFVLRPDAEGFVCAPPIPKEWRPGSRLSMRGPLGNGFALPPAAKRVALIVAANAPARLLALISPAFRGGASITLVCDDPPDDVPLQVEVQPWRTVADVCRWSDYAAFDVEREDLPEMLKRLGNDGRRFLGGEGQALVRTPMPCGAMADCGVCTVRTRRGPKLACKDGPVFNLSLLAVEG